MCNLIKNDYLTTSNWIVNIDHISCSAIHRSTKEKGRLTAVREQYYTTSNQTDSLVVNIRISFTPDSVDRWVNKMLELELDTASVVEEQTKPKKIKKVQKKKKIGVGQNGSIFIYTGNCMRNWININGSFGSR